MLLALIRHRRDRSRIQAALGELIPVEFCLSGELPTRAASARVLLTEPLDASGRSVGGCLRKVRTRSPLLPILLYLDLTVESVHALNDLLEVLPYHVIIRGVDDDPRRLRATITRAIEHPFDRQVLEAVQDFFPQELHAALHAGYAAAGQRLSVAGFAAAVQVPVRTLHGRLARRGLPAAQELVGWLRLLRVASLLADPVATVEAAALRLGFPSASPVYALARRLTGQSLPLLRQCGILPTTLNRFRLRVQSLLE